MRSKRAETNSEKMGRRNSVSIYYVWSYIDCLFSYICIHASHIFYLPTYTVIQELTKRSKTQAKTIVSLEKNSVWYEWRDNFEASGRKIEYNGFVVVWAWFACIHCLSVVLCDFLTLFVCVERMAGPKRTTPTEGKELEDKSEKAGSTMQADGATCGATKELCFTTPVSCLSCHLSPSCY